jgi:hypothetical protein
VISYVVFGGATRGERIERSGAKIAVGLKRGEE